MIVTDDAFFGTIRITHQSIRLVSWQRYDGKRIEGEGGGNLKSKFPIFFEWKFWIEKTALQTKVQGLLIVLYECTRTLLTRDAIDAEDKF